MRFQSLLYWIGYSNAPGVSLGEYRNKVSILVVLDWVFKPAGAREPDAAPDGFNPCCIGLGIQTFGGVVETQPGGGVSILVVLDWVFKPAQGSARGQAVKGFNPCCIGLGIQTGKPRQAARH